LASAAAIRLKARISALSRKRPACYDAGVPSRAPRDSLQMWRLSLRELLALVALVALAIVSLKYASSAWQIGLTSIVLIVFVGAAILAFVDRKSSQAFAIGMVLTMTIYASLIAWGRLSSSNSSNREYTTSGRLPTTRILRMLHEGFARQYWVDPQTGDEIPGFAPNQDAPSVERRRASSRQTPATIAARRAEAPSTDAFLRIGHCWWSLLLGYAGGRFARFVYLRRTREQNPLAVHPP
jgi:hypothetical protein